MRLAVIACEVLLRELSALVAGSPNTVSMYWLKQGLHDTPDILHQRLVEKIAEVEARQEELSEDKKFDAIVLGYGLCSNGIVGLGSRTLPIVAARCDDCIALFLGSQQRYLEVFSSRPGIYWYNPGWIERAFTPSEQSYERRLSEYIELYGEDNASYLMEQENGWINQYTACCYIDSPAYRSDACEEYARAAADCFGWEFLREPGSSALLSRLLSGEWEGEDILVCPPGHTIALSHDDRKIISVNNSK